MLELMDYVISGESSRGEPSSILILGIFEIELFFLDDKDGHTTKALSAYQMYPEYFSESVKRHM